MPHASFTSTLFGRVGGAVFEAWGLLFWRWFLVGSENNVRHQLGKHSHSDQFSLRTRRSFLTGKSLTFSFIFSL